MPTEGTRENKWEYIRVIMKENASKYIFKKNTLTTKVKSCILPREPRGMNDEYGPQTGLQLVY